jgi:hypothetical protein
VSIDINQRMNTVMSKSWDEVLPAELREEVVEPVSYTRFDDEASQANKVWGIDQTGKKCYYEHEFTVSEDRFDADEFPIVIDVFWERVTAWRLRDGVWAKVRKWTEQMDRCPRRYVTDPVEFVNERDLQL